MKTIFTTIFLFWGIFLQAQNIDSLTRAGEHSYHQKDYAEARNAFYKAYILDRTKPKSVSNLLLVYYKIKSYQSAYKFGHKFLRNTPSIPLQHRANIYHNLALNCEALDYPAEALHYYQKANDIKQHHIRTNKIENLRPIVDQLNAILPKIEKELPKFIPLFGEVKQIHIPSHHPISDSLHNYILRKVEDLHNTFDRSRLDSTLYFYPIRIRPHSDAPLHVLSCSIKFPWWKNDYSLVLYVDNQGHIIDIPFRNQVVENMLIEDDGDYILNTYYHPSGHGHWMIYTLYRYTKVGRQATRLIDLPKYYHINPTICPTFNSSIYVKDNLYRVRYGQSKHGGGDIDIELGNQWLYQKDSINKIPLPEIYAEPFKGLGKRCGKRYQFLEHVEFY